MTTIRILGLAAALAFAGAAQARQAAPAPQYSASDFAKSMLSAPPECRSGSEADCQAEAKTRGFSLPTLSAKAVATAGAAKAPAKGKGAAVAKPRPKVVGGADILVTFTPGSAEITPQGRANLSSVAEGLKRPSLASRKFEIAGYTDPTGSAALNVPLSQSRAEAVMAYLVSQGVEAERLSAQGYGSEVLVVPDAPSDARNRRVEIHRLD